MVSAHIFQLTKDAHHLAHIVAIKGSEVANVHALEDVLLMTDGRLQRVIQSDKALSAVVVQVSALAQPLRRLEAQLVIGGIGIEVKQIFLHSAHSSINAHIVVVEDDEQVVGRRRHVINALKGQATTHSAIANDGYHMAVVIACFLCSYGHAQCCRHRVGSMPTSKRVIRAFLGAGERAYAMQLSVGIKGFTSARQYLMSVCLVSHVPHHTVVGRVKHIVQSHGQLYHAQRRC